MAKVARRHVPPAPHRGAGGTLLGIFIGLILGVGLAAGIAYYLMRSGNPYQPAVAATAREPTREPGKPARPGDAPSDKPRFDFYKILPGVEEPKVQPKSPERTVADQGKPGQATDKSTPGTDRSASGPAADKALARLDDRAAGADKGSDRATEKGPDKASDKSSEPPPRAPGSKERVWLQAGSFAGENDAEKLKAQMALTGIEAVVQVATLPDKSTRYRVRIGPYDNVDEVNRVKADLAKRGFDATVIR